MTRPNRGRTAEVVTMRFHDGECRAHRQPLALPWSEMVEHLRAKHGIADAGRCRADLVQMRHFDGAGERKSWYQWRFRRDIGFVEVTESLRIVRCSPEYATRASDRGTP